MKNLPYFWLIKKFQLKLLMKTIFVQILFHKNKWPVLWKCVRVGWGPWGRLRALSHVTARQGSASRLSRTWICTWISGKSKRTRWQSSVSTTYNPLFNCSRHVYWNLIDVSVFNILGDAHFLSAKIFPKIILENVRTNLKLN